MTDALLPIEYDHRVLAVFTWMGMRLGLPVTR